MNYTEEQRLLNLRVQVLTIQQRQRIGAKISRYTRMIEKSTSITGKRKDIILDLIDYCYKTGFLDGLEKR